jgi:exodeoxyribonuclease VII small subunit
MDDISVMDFETASRELEGVIQRLGRDDDLVDSVRTYERGLALARRCSQLLADAERRIVPIVPEDEDPSASL